MPGLTKAEPSLKNNDVIKNLAIFIQAIKTRLGNNDGECSVFTGVLLADFPTYFQPPVVNELAQHLQDVGLDLWLELSHPKYLTEDEARMIDMRHIRGLVYRNGTIRLDGDRQNYFQMRAMRAVMRAVASQRVAHNLALVMWETVDDAAELQYGVVTRTHSWCTYNSALCWIGHADALTDAEAAKTRTVAAKPLGSLMWLKDEANMKVHDLWRANDEVGQIFASEFDVRAVWAVLAVRAGPD